MMLLRAVEALARLHRGATILARKPWAADSECRVCLPSDPARVQQQMRVEGFTYFLEVHVALEVLEVFERKEIAISLDEKVRLLLYYAENDAYPAWANELASRGMRRSS